jgi:2-keto-3-deoxy-L-fuconate dehydrogenase
MIAQFLGKVAVVTGAASGMGRSVATALADAGATVYALDMDEPGLELLSKKHNIRPLKCDVALEADIKSCAAKIEDADIIFNCAGIVLDGNLLNCTLEQWDRSFMVNVRSMFILTQLLLPGMIRRGGGSIINMASATSERPMLNRCAYGTTKAAVVALTKTIALDFASHGIRCNAVCPGPVLSPSMQTRLDRQPDPLIAQRNTADRVPLKRYGTPDEVASLVVYLASEHSSYLTGASIPVDGGWLL